MAEPPDVSVTGGNGERMEVRLGSRSIGLQTRDLLPILLLVAGIVGGYLIYTNVKAHLQRLDSQHEQIITLLHENQIRILAALQVWRNLVSEQTDDMRRLLVIHELNMGREPKDKLPLEFAPPRVKELDKPDEEERERRR